LLHEKETFRKERAETHLANHSSYMCLLDARFMTESRNTHLFRLARFDRKGLPEKRSGREGDYCGLGKTGQRVGNWENHRN